MTPDTFDPAALPLRPALAAERERAWQRLAAPGTWWDGAERLAIATEARRAPDCVLCQTRKAALSPYAIDGQHDSDGDLPAPLVEAVHRISTDAGRLTERWYAALLGPQLSAEQYVETVGVVALITALDRFDLALGLAPRPLPVPQPGAPTRRRPTGARSGLAWVPTVAPEDLDTDDPDPYTVHGSKNIHRALSLVPQEVFNFFDLDVELYLQDGQIRDFTTDYRALSHAQIELMAARVSAVNGCYY